MMDSWAVATYTEHAVLVLYGGPRQNGDAQGFAHHEIDEARSTGSFVRMAGEEPVILCRGLQAWRMGYTIHVDGKEIDAVSVFATTSQSAYFLSYMRKAGERTDAYALAALDSFCPPTDSPDSSVDD